MALNVKDAETERLAAEVAALAGETKTRAIRTALQERKDRLLLGSTGGRGEAVRRFLREEAWPQMPSGVLDRQLSRAEREAILGYGREGV